MGRLFRQNNAAFIWQGIFCAAFYKVKGKEFEKVFLSIGNFQDFLFVLIANDIFCVFIIKIAIGF
ncbi:hypothetical protein D3C72_731350 [compost metagenome]